MPVLEGFGSVLAPRIDYKNFSIYSLVQAFSLVVLYGQNISPLCYDDIVCVFFQGLLGRWVAQERVFRERMRFEYLL